MCTCGGCACSVSGVSRFLGGDLGCEHFFWLKSRVEQNDIENVVARDLRFFFVTPPTPCRSPPLVVPQGGVGDRHLVNPKFFVAAHCVVVWVTVLWGTATCIPCTHGGTFCLLSLKWNLTAQPCFPLGPDKCDG